MIFVYGIELIKQIIACQLRVKNVPLNLIRNNSRQIIRLTKFETSFMEIHICKSDMI